MSAADAVSEAEERRRRLAAPLAEAGVAALLVSDLTNVRYLTGYVGSNAIAVLGPAHRRLLTDGRYAISAREQAAGLDVDIVPRDLVGGLAAALGELPAGGRIGIEADHVSLARHERLRAALPDHELVPLEGVVEGLRLVKDEAEAAAIRRAARAADVALEAVLAQPLVGRSEREVAWQIEAELRAAGAQGSSFESIVAAGPAGARPHAVPSDAPIPPDTLVVIDMGAALDGYCSDMTRTLATGPLGAELHRAYSVCHRAHAAALQAVRPGITTGDLDAVARDIITAEGMGEAFGHGLGHGVGLEIHEGPGVRSGGTQELVAGMVVTIEPGIYLEGFGGVRIEDLVLVTADGHEVLSQTPIAAPGALARA